MTVLGLHLSQTLLGLLLLNVLLAYSAYPVFALGRMNVSFVAFAGLGGYTAAILTHRYHTVWWLATAAGVALSVVAAIPLAVLLRRVRGIYLAIATLNLVLVVHVLAVNLTGLTAGALGISGIPIKVGSGWLGIACAGVIAAAFFFHHSDRGLGVRVQHTDQFLAMSIGVNVRNNIGVLFVASAAIGALYGALGVYWYGLAIPDTYSLDIVILAIAMVVLGGTGEWLGPLVGAVFFTVVPEWLRSTGIWRDVVVGAVLLVVVLVFPEGIVGWFTAQINFWRARHSREAGMRAAEVSVQ